jgi:hypothetical protein
MVTIPTISCVQEVTLGEVSANGLALTIRCYTYPVLATSPPQLLSLDRKFAIEAMMLFLRIEREMREARAGWNQDRFRRLMRVRPMAVRRLRRRWEILNPQPPIPLGNLRRRYHANLAAYLNPSKA